LPLRRPPPSSTLFPYTTLFRSGVGCNATASNLALLPLVKADLLDLSPSIFIEIKVGSSEGGAEGNSGSLHAERANVIRTFSAFRSEEHTSELQSRENLVCRLLL